MHWLATWLDLIKNLLGPSFGQKWISLCHMTILIHVASENVCAMPESIYNIGNFVCHNMLNFINVMCELVCVMRYLICCMFSARSVYVQRWFVQSSSMNVLCIFEGPVISVIMHKIGTWRTQMIAAMLVIGSSIATSFATQYWHVIISYAIIEGRGEAQWIITGSGNASSWIVKIWCSCVMPRLSLLSLINCYIYKLLQKR